MPASTPIAKSKTAALTRISDLASKGYCRFVAGVVTKAKAKAVIMKLHQRHEVGATPGRRAVRKSHGKANAILAVYWPDDGEQVAWMMLFTPGTLDSPEPQLRPITDKMRPVWLGYELVQRSGGGKAGDKPAWTWRRPKDEMEEHFARLSELSRNRHWSAVGDLLIRLAKQPGFHGVREQSHRLFQAARAKGYEGELPTLFYVCKVEHGKAMRLD